MVADYGQTKIGQRGLLERTLVVFLTEFGRTPKINSAGGRDHWGMCGSIFFAGGGTKAGQVIGASDAQAARTPFWFDCEYQEWDKNYNKVQICEARKWPKQPLPR